ncbi:M42 family metallopeptidase [bacterium]|nr:M42 family metallopeptidase [bacterium]MBU1984901.1 M42 family metallopeptidase [bacterium]
MPKKTFPSTKELLVQLCQAFGPSGHEDDVRSLITGLIRPFVDDLDTDASGNLIAVRKGRSGKKLMLDAHTDEVGIMVRYMDENGFLRFAKLGGWDDRVFAGHRVKLRTRGGSFYHGIIGMQPPHVLTEEQRSKTIKAEDYFIDVGALSAEDAQERGIAVGDVGVLDYPVLEFAPDHWVGKAFDDRVGCLLVIQVLRALAEGRIKTPLTVYASFSTSEELGLRGARVAAYGINPDVALALEGTIGADFPGVPAERKPCSLRKGPVISVIDSTFLVPRKMTDFLFDCAKRAKVEYQVKMPIYGGTDAGAIHQTRAGVLTGVIAVASRYIHSPNSTLYWPDYERTEKLVMEAVKRIHTLVE